MHRILSSVNSKLQQAAHARASRLDPQAAANAAAKTALAPAGGEGGGATSLVALLQQLTDSVVSLVENLAVEKECLEMQLMQARSDAQDMQYKVGALCI